jgi:acyl-CoA hydrolase
MTLPRRTDDPDVLGGWLELLLRPGDHVVWSQGAATPMPLIEQLTRVRGAASGGAVFLSVGVGDTVDPVVADHLRVTGLGALGSTRALADAGVLEVVPTHLSQVPDQFRTGALRVDVVLVQVAPAVDGSHSLGLDAGYLSAAIDQARVVVAEVGRRVPETHGHRRLDADRIDLVLETDRPLPELTPPAPTAVERRIAELAVDLVPDRATLQFGIGSAPAALTEPLRGASGLTLHTGLLDDPQFSLVTSGAATGTAHPFSPGHAVTATLAGTRDLYEQVTAAGVLVREVEHTHGLATLARLPRFTAVNTAVEIDLTGQVNAEAVGARVVGGLGGLGDFLRGAAISPGGRSLLLLPSTAGAQRSPRIVGQLGSRAVTVPRSDVDVVVTEHGVAELRGASLEERARRLIAIAAPQHRDELERWWACSPDSRR